MLKKPPSHRPGHGCPIWGLPYTAKVLGVSGATARQLPGDGLNDRAFRSVNLSGKRFRERVEDLAKGGTETGAPAERICWQVYTPCKPHGVPAKHGEWQPGRVR